MANWVASQANWVVSQSTIQFVMAVTNHGALSSDEMR